MNVNRATFVPIVPPGNEVHRTKPVSANKIKGQTKGLRKSTPQESGTDAQESSPELEDGESAADSYCVFDDRQVAVVGEEMVKYGKSRACCAA